MRWVIRIGLLVLILVVGLFGVLLMLPGDRIAVLASQQISNLTGREVTMSGEATVSFYPVLGVSTGPVTIANADWSDNGPMFQADSLKIGVEPHVLWGGDIRITGFEAIGPRVHLERAADGRVNWELGVEGVAPSGQSSGQASARSDRLALTLDRALIEDATFVFDDHVTGQRHGMSGMRLDLRWPEYDGRASFEVTVRPVDTTVEITGFLDEVGAFIEGAVSDVAVSATLPGGEIGFVGRAAAAGQVDGALSVKAGDINRIMAAFGQPPIALHGGLDQGASAKAQVTFVGDQRFSLRDMALDLGPNRITGAADIILSEERPFVAARIDAGDLDLSVLSTAQYEGTRTEQDTTLVEEGWSKAPIDASFLALANGKIALSADSIDLGDLKIGPASTKISLDRSRLVFALNEVLAYDAVIKGQFVMNNRSGLSVGGNIDVKGIDMERLLTDFADVTRFSGKADASINFLGVGQTQHDIMNSLSGEGVIKTGRGVIAGIDLDRLMRSGVVGGGTTVFDAMESSFTIKDGVAFNDDLLMQLPLARAEGRGTIGLGPRNIDYLFVPVLLEGEGTQGLAIPVRIRGPWTSPQIAPDLEEAIDLNLAAERKALEDQAEVELRRAVEKELGVELEEGQDIEDAMQDSLEEELLKGLKGLFD